MNTNSPETPGAYGLDTVDSQDQTPDLPPSVEDQADQLLAERESVAAENASITDASVDSLETDQTVIDADAEALAATETLQATQEAEASEAAAELTDFMEGLTTTQTTEIADSGQGFASAEVDEFSDGPFDIDPNDMSNESGVEDTSQMAA